MLLINRQRLIKWFETLEPATKIIVVLMTYNDKLYFDGEKGFAQYYVGKITYKEACTQFNTKNNPNIIWTYDAETQCEEEDLYLYRSTGK